MDERLKKYLTCECFYSTMETKKAKESTNDKEINPSAEEMLSEINKTSFCDFMEDVFTSPDKVVDAKNIPQISNLRIGTTEILKMLKNHNDYGMTFADIGRSFLEGDRKEDAYIKFGENHAKLAKELDLLYFVRQGHIYVYISDFGYALMEYTEENQKELLAKQMFIIPTIRYIIKQASKNHVNVVEILNQYVSKATAIRRGCSVRKILKYISLYTPDYDDLWKNIE